MIKLNRKVLLVMILLTTLVMVVSSCTSAVPRIELSAASFNWGDINPAAGIRTETFWVKNSGTALLNITGVSTSCGCTKAEVDKEVLQPGEQAQLIISYDPGTHKGLVGPIKRMVYIQSNDPLHQEVSLELVGNMLPDTGENEGGNDGK